MIVLKDRTGALFRVLCSFHNISKWYSVQGHVLAFLASIISTSNLCDNRASKGTQNMMLLHSSPLCTTQRGIVWTGAYTVCPCKPRRGNQSFASLSRQQEVPDGFLLDERVRFCFSCFFLFLPEETASAWGGAETTSESSC
jgi:hypothetical protein